MLLKRLGAFFLEIIEIIVFAVSIFLFLYLLVLQPHKIKGASMEPNFHNNEYLITDKVSYRFDEPQRGDVIVFKAPPTYSDEFIKRIIAIPGDKVKIENSKIVLNGKELSEPYLPSDFVTVPNKFLQEGDEITVPANSYLVFGDNRDHSLDSRVFGFVAKDKITGKAWFIYWPPSEVGLISAR